MPHRDDLPEAGPGTQAAPAARGGGTYGQGDFSRSAQASRYQTDRKSDLPGEAMDRAPANSGPPESDGKARERFTNGRR